MFTTDKSYCYMVKNYGSTSIYNQWEMDKNLTGFLIKVKGNISKQLCSDGRGTWTARSIALILAVTAAAATAAAVGIGVVAAGIIWGKLGGVHA